MTIAHMTPRRGDSEHAQPLPRQGHTPLPEVFSWFVPQRRPLVNRLFCLNNQTDRSHLFDVTTATCLRRPRPPSDHATADNSTSGPANSALVRFRLGAPCRFR